MSNPYRIEGPALVSFSGGRTSAFMLRQILDAHGGTLPEDVVVTFANTGKEREETLRFVHECESRWGVRVHWLEHVSRSGPKPERFEEVGYNSASRAGEPFARLIASKGYTPNAVTRFCTTELKVRVMRDFAQQTMGWTRWTNIIGLRADEMLRVWKAKERSDSGKEPWRNRMPMADAGHALSDVRAFWAEQPFDLGLRHYEGNCDLCFLKGRGKLKTIMREQPGAADWWIEQEAIGKGRFVTEYDYASLAREVAEQPHLFDEEPDSGDEHDVECGLLCAPLEMAA